MRTRPVLATLVALLLTACANLGEKVARHLKESRFEEARKVLDENGAGGSLQSAVDAEALAARQDFQNAIEQATDREVNNLLLRGKAYESQKLAEARLATCPWSDKLAKLKNDCDAKIAQIVAAEARWTRVLGVADPQIESVREFLTEGTRRPSWFFDSETLITLRDVAIEKLLRSAVVGIKRARGRLTPEDRAELEQDLQLAKAPKKQRQQLVYVLGILGELAPASGTRRKHLSRREVAALNLASRPNPLRPSRRPGTALRSGEPGTQQAKAERDTRQLTQESILTLDQLLGSVLDSDTEPRSRAIEDCVLMCWNEVDHWVVAELGAVLRGPEVAYQELREGERWLIESGIRSHLALDVGRAHVTVAERLARHSLAAAVALVHLSRAVDLGLSTTGRSLIEAKTLAQATRKATPRPALRLNLKCEPDVDPRFEVIVSAALRSVLTGKKKALSELTTYATRPDQPAVTVRIQRAELVSDFSEVRKVSSSYLSHYQRVPNPRKRSLKWDLDFAESRVDRAKSSYNWAVSSHNINPTEWSLRSVNSDRNDYVRAVDDYNSKVNLYNATPSTIQEPVFMPYSFRQGTVRFGWRVAVHVGAPGVGGIRLQHESIATDYVRIGAKVSDKTKNYRRNDPLGIDVSADAGLSHLFKVAKEIRDSMKPGLGKLAYRTTAALDPEQQTILAWLHHPLGIQRNLAKDLGVPEWASQCLNPAELLSSLHRPEPPEVLALGCEATQQGPLTPEAAAKLLAPFVCQTRASGRESATTGTGTLIGKGLVLTCSHVLTAPKLLVSFPTGPWQGSYDAEVVFVNAQRDVALLRAKGLKNDRWANLRLERQADAGERILAIGNSGLNVGGTNLGGVASGIVSNPMLKRNDTHYLSADVSIASGSSGGPLFSLKDGSLVGVVQLVANAPGLGKGQASVSSTGYLALAAPANLLGEWLGLRAAPKK